MDKDIAQEPTFGEYFKEGHSEMSSDEKRTNITTTLDNKENQFLSERSTKTVENPFYHQPKQNKLTKSAYRYISKINSNKIRKLSQQNDLEDHFDDTFGARSRQKMQHHFDQSR